MVVEVIVEYPWVRWRGDVVAAAFPRKLHAGFACKGSDCGGGDGGGGGGGRIIAGQDSCLDATALSIGAP